MGDARREEGEERIDRKWATSDASSFLYSDRRGGIGSADRKGVVENEAERVRVDEESEVGLKEGRSETAPREGVIRFVA